MPFLLNVILLSLLTPFSVINALPERYQEVLDETKKCSNFNAFMITGGPSAEGNGSFKIFSYVFSPGSHVLR